MKIAELNAAQKLFLEFCEHYKSRNLKAFLALFTQNSNMWGSGVDEYRIGLKEIEDQIKRDWSQSDKGEIEVISFVPSPTDANWAAALCKAKITIDGKEHIFGDFRGTIVIAKENNQWKVAHSHASFPDYRNAPQASFPLNS